MHDYQEVYLTSKRWFSVINLEKFAFFSPMSSPEYPLPIPHLKKYRKHYFSCKFLQNALEISLMMWEAMVCPASVKNNDLIFYFDFSNFTLSLTTFIGSSFYIFSLFPFILTFVFLLFFEFGFIKIVLTLLKYCKFFLVTTFSDYQTKFFRFSISINSTTFSKFARTFSNFQNLVNNLIISLFTLINNLLTKYINHGLIINSIVKNFTILYIILFLICLIFTIK